MIKLILSLALCGVVVGQYETFPLGPRSAAKPTIAPELRHYFELDGHAAQLVDSLIGPRPGGFFPEKTYDVASRSGSGGQEGSLEKTLESFFSSPVGSNPGDLPPGFNQGFSLLNGNQPALTSFQDSAKPTEINAEEKAQGGSSISGIPNYFPKLPKYPVQAPPEIRRQKVTLDHAPEIPKIESRPAVPEGGFGPVENEIRRHPTSVSEVVASSDSESNSEYGNAPLADENPSGGGLIGTLFDMIGLNKDHKPAENVDITKTVGNLLGGPNSPIPGKDLLSSALYKALTAGSIQKNGTDPSNSTLTLTPGQQAAVDEGVSMLGGIITNPSSPFCNPKPVPVSQFSIDAFMGQWYQVLYSQIASKNPCSMLAYKKLSDVGNGGIGTIFEIFEYSTDGTPYTAPKITSGYGILKQVGELIYRTSSSKDDVDVHVLHTGPINANGEYEFVVLSTNCNFPIHVLARDPTVYKQRYEAAVKQILQQKGLMSGFSVLFNVVQDVDVSTCTFPPSLFKFRG
ncbi:hypothetical protein FO519_003360 [Halicephalobus sp. NKZ332]|nr:hypothetical protein FO519_003360 [Halicephalobus sp. NKZ332]